MPRDDLELARVHCEGMRELIANNPAHWKEEPALDLLRALCERACAVIVDQDCRAYLSAIEDYAAALSSDMTGRGWSPLGRFEPVLRRREILRKLQLLSDRLAELKKRKAAAVPDLSEQDTRRRERYASVLSRAAETVGGTARLAPLLGVPLRDLECWVAGAEAAPLAAFLAGLDFVAGGPFAREPHRVRVAVIPQAEAPRGVAAIGKFVRHQDETPTQERPAFHHIVFHALFGLTLILTGSLLTIPLFGDGAVLAFGTAAQLAGSLCASAVLLAWWTRARLGTATAVVSTLLTGASALYLSYSAWRDMPAAPAPAPLAAATADMTVALKSAARRPKVWVAAAQVAAPEANPSDACASLSGAASLQCLRCGAETGLSWLLCQETARLEYCEPREGMESICPSLIPASSPH